MKLSGPFCNDVNMKKIHIQKYLYVEKGPPQVLLPLLKGVSNFQRWGMWIRSKRRVYSPRIYTVSFGGITIGGVGKTPAVIERANREMGVNKKKICVISRGYGAEKYQGIVEGIYRDGEIRICEYGTGREYSPMKETVFALNNAYKVLGDELTLILYRLRDVTVIRDSNRVRAVKWAESKGFDIAILDDAYQYLMLGRNENILLISALNPWGNGLIFPAGILREPLDAINRATEVWITHCDQVLREKLEKLKDFFTQMYPEKTIRWTYHKPLFWSKINSLSIFPLDYFGGKEVDVFCAIGSPQSFLNILKKQQLKIKNTYIYRDHAPIPKGILKKGRIILTTEKNLLTLGEESEEVYALCIGLSDYCWD